MAEWPLYGGGRYESAGADTAASRGTTLTAAGSAHTKNSTWTQLIASTRFDANTVQITLSPGTSHIGYLVDVGIGGSGSEVTLIPNLTVRSRIGSAVVYEFPLYVAAGSRISARCQSATASATCFVSVVLGHQPWGMGVPLGQVLDLGIDTGTSAPTLQYNPGGTAHTKGGYSTLVASTGKPIRGLVMAISTGNSAMSDADWLMDVGIGIGGSEQLLLPNLAFAASASSDFFAPMGWPCKPVDVPAGSRLAVNAQCSIIDASDRLFFVAAYGMV